jgi:hypothetical protein
MITKYKQFFEQRNQLEIPFDNKHPLHDKPDYVHIKDALLDIGKEFNIDDYNTYQDFWENFNNEKNQSEAKNYFYENILDGDYDFLQLSFLDDYHIDGNEELYKVTEEELEEIKKENQYDNIPIDFEEEDILTDKGIKVYVDYKYNEHFEFLLNESDISTAEFIDDYGLLTLYRAITFGKSNAKDIYENIISYGKIGIFWSYIEDVAEAHNGSGEGDTWILEAKVRPECVNYVNTIYKSAYSLREECEIELLEDSEILITNIEHMSVNYSIPLENPILVKA